VQYNKTWSLNKAHQAQTSSYRGLSTKILYTQNIKYIS